MKKVKFTLGLVLAMLLISANFVNAAKEIGFRTEEEKSTRTSIGYLFNISPNPQIISIESVLRDYSSTSGRAIWTSPTTPPTYNFNLYRIVSVDSGLISFPNATTLKDIRKDYYSYLAFGSEEYYGYSHGGKNIRYDGVSGTGAYATSTLTPSPTSKANGVWSIFDNNYDLSNDIIVELSYTEGIEIMPVIKRTIVLGEWYYATADGDKDKHGNTGKGNRLDPTDVVVYDYLLADSVTFRPFHDRKDGVARYVFKQNVQEMFGSFPVFSITYDISIHDEIGTIEQEAYEPPMMAEPQNMRGLTFDIGSGIKTNIPMNTTGNILYVPSNLNCVFTVYSDKEIDATCTRSDNPYDGISVKKDLTQANAYIVTVKRVQSNFNVKVVQKSDSQSGTGEEGTTGNNGTPTDAVWGSKGILNVTAATPGTISIYNVTGQLYRTEAISGSYTLTMPKGLYIVQFNGKAYKVVL